MQIHTQSIVFSFDTDAGCGLRRSHIYTDAFPHIEMLARYLGLVEQRLDRVTLDMQYRKSNIMIDCAELWWITPSADAETVDTFRALINLLWLPVALHCSTWESITLIYLALFQIRGGVCLENVYYECFIFILSLLYWLERHLRVHDPSSIDWFSGLTK